MARNFNGTTQALVTPSWNLPTTGRMTCSAWVFLTTAGATDWNAVANWGQAIGGMFQFGTTGAGLGLNDLNIAVRMAGGASTNPVSEGVQFPANSWQHICFTADGSNLNLYRGGVSKGTPAAYNGTLLTVFAPLGIGAVPNDTGTAVKTPPYPFYFPGYIAHVSMWDQGLTAGEVASLANGAHTLSVRPQSLLNYWSLSQGYSPEPDLINDKPMNLINAPTIAQSPRTFYPRQKLNYKATSSILLTNTLNSGFPRRLASGVLRGVA